MRWCDAPKEYGPHKTLYNRWKRWSDKGVFSLGSLWAWLPEDPEEKTAMIDATYLKNPPHGDQPAGQKKGGVDV